MKQTVGKMIRAKREQIGIARAELSKKMKIHVGYLSHIENDYHIVLSDRVVGAIRRTLGLEIPKKLIEENNEKARKWRSHYVKSLKN